ncbi:MAG: tetratricopeptide repeat protein [Alphaproteobacteria bacterium]
MGTVNVLSGRHLLNAGNIHAAAEVAQRALSVNPTDCDALELRFDCLFYQKDYKAAREKAEAWLEHDPGVLKAHECLIQALFCLKDKKASRQAVDVLKSGFPLALLQHKLYDALYDVHFSNGKAARKILEELSKEYPEAYALVRLQADAAFQRDQMFMGYRLYREAIKMEPTDALTWRMYAVNAYHLMRYGEARKAARKALELDPSLVEMKLIIRLSWLVYVPVFYLASLLSTSYFCASEFLGKTLGMAVSFFAGYMFFGPLIIKALKWLSLYGVDVSIWHLLGGICLWIVIEQGTFTMIDKKKVKVKNVELSDY